MSAIKLVNITKKFPGVIANDHITLEINAGEVHTILGENGAGKTTLMNIISGLYQADEGEIYVFGKKVKISSPRDAIRLGIFMVPQTPKLVASMTVLENLVIGLKEVGIVTPTKKVRGLTEDIFEKFGIKVDLDAPVWKLSASEQKRVEILKALIRGAKILILDEPTAQLSPLEKKELFSFMRKLAESGGTVLFITHKISEALEVSDRISVLRKGKLVGTLTREEATPQKLMKMMFGEESIEHKSLTDGVPAGEPVLVVKDIYVRGDMGELAVKGVSLTLRAREIVGIAGVAGNGQKELIEAIYGLRKVIKGKIFVKLGNKLIDVTNKGPRELIKLGFSFIPENRIRNGVVPYMSIAENLVLKSYYTKKFSKGLLLKLDEMKKFAEEVIKEFSVAAPGPDAPVRHLSGGNIQKLIVARELAGDPKVIIAAYPTLGLDVSSTMMIRRLLVERKKRGSGVILLSEDLDEILELSDRILVMYEGRIVGEFSRGNADVQKIGRLMLGG